MKIKIKEKKLFKIVNKDGHKGLIYKEGWNIDPLPFNPHGNCEDGGIYFAGRDILAFLCYGESVYEVTNYSTPYENPDTPKKYKAHKVKLKYIGEWKNVEVMKYLIKHGADVHADNDYAIRYSAINGYLEVVKYLIEHGADVHADNDFALRCSVEMGNLEVVKYLLEQGADVHAAIKILKRFKDFTTVSTLEKFYKNR